MLNMFVVERIGRRRLALGSLLGVFLSLAFLGIGFHLADMNTPLVQVKEDWSGDCPLNKDCGTCIDDHNDCGFCFIKPNGDDEGLASNASCVKVSDKDSKFAEHGRCANPMSNEMKFATDYCPSNTAWLIILGLISYLFFFAPGMGPMPWTINAEIYPLWARSLGNSLATSTNWALNLLVSMTFLSLTEAITKQGTFYMYTGIALVGFLIFLKILPETRGKSLEEMEQLFA